MDEEINEEEFEKLSTSVSSIPRMKKSDFVKEFKETIIEWIREKEPEIINILRQRKYSWHGKSYEDSMRARDQLESMIKESRKKNNGGINLETVDKVCLWGFGQKSPLRDRQKIINITREAFEHIDKEDYFEAVKTLINISGVGISRASKIIGLSNQNELCIYDSRVGHALRDLRRDNTKLVKCPPDRSFKRDCDYTTKNGWAANYEKLIWTIEIMREYFRTKSYSFRAADIEVILFTMGE